MRLNNLSSAIRASLYDELFHHAEREDLKSVGIAFDGGGMGGVDMRDGGVLTPEPDCCC